MRILTHLRYAVSYLISRHGMHRVWRDAHGYAAESLAVAATHTETPRNTSRR